MAGLNLLVRQVVLLPFPFSDLSNQKLRPALVLADAGRDDWGSDPSPQGAGSDPNFAGYEVRRWRVV